ncbi:MAG: hypothetical protein OEL80_07795 [Desulfuromonadales bacterium]|nr:hypothetical protein [Desulfuromonadales bacterium]
MPKNQELTFCCERFEEAVEEHEIYHSPDNDETEWYIDMLWHLYYCPFCGTFIKGKGWGEYHKAEGQPQK